MSFVRFLSKKSAQWKTWRQRGHSTHVLLGILRDVEARAHAEISRSKGAGKKGSAKLRAVSRLRDWIDRRPLPLSLEELLEAPPAPSPPGPGASSARAVSRAHLPGALQRAQLERVDRPWENRIVEEALLGGIPLHQLRIEIEVASLAGFEQGLCDACLDLGVVALLAEAASADEAPQGGVFKARWYLAGVLSDEPRLLREIRALPGFPADSPFPRVENLGTPASS